MFVFLIKHQFKKAILIGVVAGAAIFFVPFPFRFFFTFLLIFFAFRFFAWGRWRRGGKWQNNHLQYSFIHNRAYAERWRNMSDDERKAFIKKMESELFADKTATE